jgi:hypothetical protein
MGNKLIFAVLRIGVLIVVLSGCGSPDTREPRGALALASQAVEAGDARTLFRVIDERSRHALAAIQRARGASAALVRADYPPEAQAAALAQLGDAALATDPTELFVRRCPPACLAEIGATLGAPAGEQTVPGEAGPELEITTTTGGRVRLFKSKGGHYGIVFRRRELFDERNRASRELEQIRTNAKVYRKRKALEGQN